MKRIDKLIITSFLGPFFLTFVVVVFILLLQHMLKYFDDIIGKDIGFLVLIRLLGYFTIFLTPIATPLAVLLSSLMTFGNLGEHFELTAIKSAGISLVRVLYPIFIFVIGLTFLAFYSNNYLVPRAALEAYSLLYDIKQKKPTLDLKEGTFYNGIPELSIKIEKKLNDKNIIKDVIIYDHRNSIGNKKVIMADSGYMEIIGNNSFLKLVLYNGNFYFEDQNSESNSKSKESLLRSSFHQLDYIFDLSSFGLGNTDKKLFQGNRIMRNLTQLNLDIDSIKSKNEFYKNKLLVSQSSFFYYFGKNDSIFTSTIRNDTINKEYKEVKPKNFQNQSIDESRKNIDKNIKSIKNKFSNLKKNYLSINDTLSSQQIFDYVDSVINNNLNTSHINSIKKVINQNKRLLNIENERIDFITRDLNIYKIQYHKILSNSFACIIMFLIGSPLGAIIKRGGLGIPVLLSILFFIIFYVLTMTGEKYAKQDIIEPIWGIWSANIILLPIGLFFLRQAKNDVRLFEADFYHILFHKFSQIIKKIAKK